MSELSVLVKATVVLALALIAVRVARRSPAAVRALLLASAFAALLILPLVAFMAPQRRIEIPISSAVPTAVFFDDDTALRQPAVIRSPASNVSDKPWPFTVPSVPSLLRIGWASGCLLFTIPVVLSLLRLRRLRYRGLPWVAGAALIERMARQDGVRRRIGVFVHGDLATPMTCGLFRPAIGLPLDAQDWDATALRQALAHELEHVRRIDWPVQVLCRLACSLYWFHPLAWIAWRQWCLESERACDDAVLRNSDRTLYAEQLVLLARRLSHDAGAPMLSMAERSNLATRIAAVLDSTMARGRARSLHAAAILFAAIALVAAIAPLHAVIAPIEAVTRSAAASLRPAPPQAADARSTDHAVIERAERPAPIDVPPSQASERTATPPAAQAPPQATAAPRAFEVASVRRNTSGAQLMQGALIYPGGRLTALNTIVRVLIASAYGVPFNRVTGGPGWIDTDRFDVEAQSGPEASQADIRAMLQALLIERFRLASHIEAREMPIFALMPARSDGTIGPALRRSGPECAPITPPRSGPPLPPPPPTSSSPEAGVPLLAPGTAPVRCGRMFFGGFIAARQITMADLATSLAMFAGRPVVDRTGLTGGYDLDLTFAPRPVGPGAAEPPPDGPPSIFTALSEQLGLKLEPDRGAVEMLVIDRVEPPTAN